MNYERAVAEATKGNKLIRPHWHWIYLSASEKHDGRLSIFDLEDGHERTLFKANRSDRKATDWVVL